MRHETIYPDFSGGKRLMFITNPSPKQTIEAQVAQVIQGGGTWIQLRMKEGTDLSLAQKVAQLCEKAQPQVDLCIDDDIRCALQVGATAVHLGKKDMPVLWAHEMAKSLEAASRPLLVGATANTFRDIQWAVSQGASYIGLGPFRFTETKKKLSPILGLEGYRQIIAQCEQAGIRIPIFAIGGITIDDVPSLMRTGVTGIAISGAIINAEDPVKATQQFIETINSYKI